MEKRERLMSQPDKPDLAARLRDVPHKPGVYLMRDRFGKVIYVGKARDLRRRLASYFTPSRLGRADIKTRALIGSIWDFDLQLVRNEHEALLLEGKLIKDFRPRYNVSFRDDKRFLLVRIKIDEAWPRFQLVRLRKDDGALYFGPYAHSGALRATLEWVRKRYGLRACRPAAPDESTYRHCHADVIENCSAPCVGRIDREGYLARVEEACRFLEGKDKSALAGLEEEMADAAGRQEFEKAAELRDMLVQLRKTVNPVRRFTRAGRMGAGAVGPGIDPEADIQELAEELGLGGVVEVMECFDISNISSHHIVASMVRFVGGMPDRPSYRRYRIRTVEGQDDFASMAEVVRRRYARILRGYGERYGEVAEETQEGVVEAVRRLDRSVGVEGGGEAASPRLPDLVIVDGGKGQLSSAHEELRRMGLVELPIVGLAKEREEIFLPGRGEPIRLPHERGALKLMQRIRDEAHRYANGYHQLLMKRRVQESLLDDCPGISRHRKAILLRHFGSIERLRRASVEEVGAVKGIGAVLAREVVGFLGGRG